MIKIYEKVIMFLDDYQEELLKDETRNNLIIGITRRGTHISLIVSSRIDDEFVVGVLAGKNLILASNTSNGTVYRDLVEFMENQEYPGIIGVLEDCELYHKIYGDLTGKELQVKMNQRIYQCVEVNNIAGDFGVIRLATKEDADLLSDWLTMFAGAAKETTSKEEALDSITRKINDQRLYVLEVDGEVVSMTARTRTLVKTETVSYVFTPQELRGKGYASRLVEEITRIIHSEGRIATLYTDLANPTSNSIYMKIGYVPHCDSIMLNKEG